MTKLKKVIAMILAAMVIMFACAGAMAPAFADETSAPEQTEETIAPDISSNDGDLDGLVEQFTAYLKDKYGDDYEFYYNQIIDQWGSIEAYLLSFGDKLPEEYQTAWQKFVGWLHEYSVIWATVLAILIVIILSVVGKKLFKKIVEKIVEKIVNRRLNPIVQELNAQSRAIVTLIHAQKALMRGNEKFHDIVIELDEAEEALK